MSRLFYHVMQDNTGNLLFDVSGTMRLAGTGTAATIYGDEALTVPIPNPMTNHPSFGSFKCFLGAGDYDFYMAKAGYTFETLTGVQGHGTLAQQDASAVAVTGGSATGLTELTLLPNAKMGLGTGVPVSNFVLAVNWRHGSDYGLVFRPNDGNDVGAGHPVQFYSAGGGQIGSISTSGSATAYNTTSDARLKGAIAPLTGALDVVRALRPVSFLWNADGSPGRGFLAGEVQEVIPDGVITGGKDAMNPDGTISPQQIDYSKLVPYLVGAVKELAQQVEMLQAQLAAAVA